VRIINKAMVGGGGGKKIYGKKGVEAKNN